MWDTREFSHTRTQSNDNMLTICPLWCNINKFKYTCRSTYSAIYPAGYLATYLAIYPAIHPIGYPNSSQKCSKPLKKCLKCPKKYEILKCANIQDLPKHLFYHSSVVALFHSQLINYHDRKYLLVQSTGVGIPYLWEPSSMTLYVKDKMVDHWLSKHTWRPIVFIQPSVQDMSIIILVYRLAV